MSITITAPVPVTGPSQFGGDVVLDFVDGTATTDELPEGIRHYLLSTGYIVDGEQVEKAAEPEPVDPRDITHVQLGTELRDGAVDPEASDFLAPVNAGKANPHGPEVVAPGIHAEGERVVRSGEVPSDPDTQEKAEKSFAEKVLIDQEPLEGQAEDWKDTGPLGLSDPGSVTIGQEQAKVIREEQGQPKGNASTEAWAEYAKSQGATDESLEGKSRDDIRAEYGA